MNDSDDAFSRRRVLQSAPVALSAGLAGCTGALDDGGDDVGDDSDGEEHSDQDDTGDENGENGEEPPEPDPPNIERQTVLRDNAAITHIRQTVTGEVVWPSFESYNIIDPDILGEWVADDVVFRFDSDGRFEDIGEEFEGAGTYYTFGEYFLLQYDTGEEFTYLYEVGSDAGDVYVDFWNESGDFLARFWRATAWPDERSVVEVAEDVVLIQDDNPQTEGEQLETGGAGTGFVVSSDGYIVTNAHVVGTHQDPNETLYGRLAVRQREELREVIEADSDVSGSEGQEIENVLFSKIMDYYAEHSEARNVSTDIGVLHGSATPEEEFAVESWPATVETSGTVVEAVSGEPSWGRDIAIISVDQAPLPTVPLGDSSDLGTGDDVFVIGYPDIGIDELFDDRDSTLEPTLTSGVVSARRELNSGVDTIQTDAGINNGNSGGPMYNSDGEVVGVATFGPADVDLQEIQFALPIEIAKGFMGELGVENEPGDLDVAFREGLDAYWREDCEAVEEQMGSVLEQFPDHPNAQDFIDDC